jgi:peptidoglycan hydrolase-like protein with peptidoglycan-binding domain
LSLRIIDTYLVPSGEMSLKSGSRPLFIIIYSAGAECKTIYDIDAIDKYQKGKVMFGGHFFVSKDGSIFRGRPLGTFGEFATDERTGRSFDVNSIGICVQGDYEMELMATAQKNAVINLIQQLRHDHPSIRTTYALDELIEGCQNPGALFPMNEIIALSLNIAVQSIRLAPNGMTRYAFTERTLYYDARVPVTGNDVRELQIILLNLGFECEINGKFDLMTMNAVMSFQKSHNLAPNGTVDGDTFNLVRKQSEKFYENRLTFSRILYLNAPNYFYGNDVKRLQERLNLLGHPCTVTGFYDEETVSSVTDFQEMHSIPADGRVGPVTWSQITTSDFDFVKRVLSYSTPMLFGDDVRLVQQRLSDVGYPIPTASGWFDEITMQQVMNFQRASGLEPSGAVDQETARELFK